MGRLREENVALLNRQAAADDFFLLQDQYLTGLEAELAEEKKARSEAETTVVDLTAELDAAREETVALCAELAPYRAAEANANKITVRPMVRIGADQPTAPQGIDVRTLREALTVPCAECTAPVEPGTTYCSARCRNAADNHNEDGDQ